MKIALDLSALTRTRWYEYLVRFLLGGAATVAAAIIARQFGPAAGGLFLAFPAIFPASATLIEKHEREKKRRAGITDSVRGRQAAGLDASGAVLGGVALIGFAWLVWKQLQLDDACLIFAAAAIAWLLGAGCLWWLRKKHLLKRHRRWL